MGRVFGVRFRSPSCGCRFGSEPGRFWVCVGRLWSGFSSGGVQLAQKKGHRPKNRRWSEDHFFDRLESGSLMAIQGVSY